jgi:hypothetical protein
MKVIELPHTQLQLTSEGIMIIRCNDDFHYELEHVLELHQAQKEIANGNKFPTVTIIGKFTEASKEALDFVFSKEATAFALKDAFVVNSLSQKIIGNFYLKVKKPDIPTRLFTNENLAIEWLKKAK